MSLPFVTAGKAGERRLNERGSGAVRKPFSQGGSTIVVARKKPIWEAGDLGLTIECVQSLLFCDFE